MASKIRKIRKIHQYVRHHIQLAGLLLKQELPLKAAICVAPPATLNSQILKLTHSPNRSDICNLVDGSFNTVCHNSYSIQHLRAYSPCLYNGHPLHAAIC